MERYEISLKGISPLIMHKDNLAYSEKIRAWQKAPENKANSISGDDRTPAWTWIGYLYNDGKHIGIDADNIMTMLREGGAKVLIGKGKETYKKQTQSGILVDQVQLDFYVNGKKIEIENLKSLIGETDFTKHLEVVESLGFELLVKRAKIGRSKHIRVRPMFRNWTACGSLTVIDSEISGIKEEILNIILNQAGALCGLCDWRPSSPNSGSFGRFEPTITAIA